MPPPDPKVLDASSPAQQQMQGYLNPVLMRMLQGGPQGFWQQNLDQNNFEQQSYESLVPGLLQMFNQGLGPAQSFFDAYAPVHEQQMQFGLGQLGAAAPFAGSSAFATQGIDFANQQMNSFNLFAEQAQQNFLKQALEAAGMIGTLGQQAGTAVERRFTNPLLQSASTSAQYANPRTEVYQQPGFFDYLSQGAQGAAAIAAAV